jgi:hypothetical protein
MSQSTLTSPLHALLPTGLFTQSRALSDTRARGAGSRARRVEVHHRPAPHAHSLELEMLSAQARILQATR